MSQILEDLVEIVIDKTSHVTAEMTPEAAADYVSALVVRFVHLIDAEGAAGDIRSHDICRRLADQLRDLPDVPALPAT